MLATGLLCALSGMPSAEAQAFGEERDEAITELDPTRISAPPLNNAFVVNAGGFGAKDPMEIPLAIQSYTAKTIADSSARTAGDVLTLDPSILSASYGSSFDNFRLRGFAMDNFNTIRRDGLTLAPHHDVPWKTSSGSMCSKAHRVSCTGSIHPAAPSTTSSSARPATRCSTSPCKALPCSVATWRSTPVIRSTKALSVIASTPATRKRRLRSRP